MSKDGRTRNFATVVYPDSAPDGWMSTLADQHVAAFISPLHSRDLNPDGEPKKPHYHVMIMYQNVKTEDQAKELFALVGGVGCEKVQNLRGYARYLCHLDNPDKVQYDPIEVKALSGADFYGVINLPVDRDKALSEMKDFCDRNRIISFNDLVRYASAQRYDWYRVLTSSGTVFIKEFLKTLKWELETLDLPYNRLLDGQIFSSVDMAAIRSYYCDAAASDFGGAGDV